MIPGWRPALYCPEQTQARRKKINDMASKKKRAIVRDIRVGEQVIIKDRKPGWKVSTPYEPGVWNLTEVSGTMVTAKKGTERVKQNISGFRKTMFGGLS
ncbi:hypothetical protein NDU88_004103 [Pleurodeles waltl]|uniref:Uncharacterized protein n=1 Tax=Pleurodeles waltl TaxID=8319 RepID=A0AAV7WQX1_PLEWA|nr:hypothetical protein NDU88_004103 [Pleurodeles waltl]